MANTIGLHEKREKILTFLSSGSMDIKTSITTPNDNKSVYKEFNNINKRIIDLLEHIDIYEDKLSCDCIPDYKFPEIRWDENTKTENPNSMTDKEIRNKFQLLTKESKQKKREVCRQCYQTGKRGIAFEIPYFYKGNEDWDSEIPIKGKDAELGCEGCAWYDFKEWRKHLLNDLEKL